MDQESSNTVLLQLQTHIQQLKKLNNLTAWHQQYGQDTAEFMISQYGHRRERLLDEIIVDILSQYEKNNDV